MLYAFSAIRCGRTTPRFRVTGRSDDMVVVRGLNLFPAMIAGVISGFSDLSGANLTNVLANDADFWDGRNRLGNFVSSGLYVVKVSYAGETVAKPLSIVR